MRALFLPRYSSLAGSSRYMTYDYLHYYEAVGIQCEVNPLLDERYLKRLSLKLNNLYAGNSLLLGGYLLVQAVKRLLRVLAAGQYDVVVLEKDIIPYLPYGLEELLFFFNRRVVVMYDEATYNYYSMNPRFLVRTLTRDKVARIIQRASHVVAWNNTIGSYACRLNSNVTAVGLGIDLNRYRCKRSYQVKGRPIRIGWIGSPSGYGYLHVLDDVFKRLHEIYDVELFVVSSKPYQTEGFRISNRRWSVATEVEYLLEMDIGIMPLPEGEWASGKSGCKMLQYMGIGLPVVVSPVGINNDVVQDGISGLTAVTEDDWYHQLVRLIRDPELRRRLGTAGRKYVEENNDQAIIAQRLIEVIQSVGSMMR